MYNLLCSLIAYLVLVVATGRCYFECWASTVSKGAGTGPCAFEQWYGLAVARCCMHPYVQFTVQPHSLSRSGCCNRTLLVLNAGNRLCLREGAGTGACAFEQWYGVAVARCCMHPYVQFTVQPHSLSRSGCCNRTLLF